MASVVKSLQKLFTREPRQEKHSSPKKEQVPPRKDEREILRLKILGGVLKK